MTIQNLNCFVSQITKRPGWKTSRIELTEANGGSAVVTFGCTTGEEPQLGQFCTVRVAFDAEAPLDADNANKAQRESVA